MGRALSDRGSIIGAHAHTETGQAVLPCQFCQKGKMRRRFLLNRGNAHEAGDGQPQAATVLDERRRVARRNAALLRAPRPC